MCASLWELPVEATPTITATRVRPSGREVPWPHSCELTLVPGGRVTLTQEYDGVELAVWVCLGDANVARRALRVIRLCASGVSHDTRCV